MNEADQPSDHEESVMNICSKNSEVVVIQEKLNR